MCDALRELNPIIFKVLRRDPESEGLSADGLPSATSSWAQPT
jgi:hypothetical protein